MRARREGWLKVVRVETDEGRRVLASLTGLGVGEAEAIAVAKERNAAFLTNDRSAYREAEKLGVKALWITQILLEALKNNIIKNYEEFKELLTSMVNNGLWIEREILEEVLDAAKRLHPKYRK